MLPLIPHWVSFRRHFLASSLEGMNLSDGSMWFVKLSGS